MTIEWGDLRYGAQVHDQHLSIFLKPEMIHIDCDSRIDGAVKIEGGQGVFIGQGVHISTFVHLNIGGGRLIIGDYVAVASGARILTGTNTPDGQSMSSAAPAEMQVVERSEVVIEDYAFVGAGVTILPGVHIGRYAVIGAGAVVTHDVPPYAIMAGVPAQQIGDRREREEWHWGDDDIAAPPLPEALEHEAEIIKRGILRRFGMEVSDEYARSFAAFIGGKYAY